MLHSVMCWWLLFCTTHIDSLWKYVLVGLFVNDVRFVVAVHQLGFFPWLGFFDQLWYCDTFYTYDTCQKDSNLGWTKRVKILEGNGPEWLGFATRRLHRNEHGDYLKERIRHLRCLEVLYVLKGSILFGNLSISRRPVSIWVIRFTNRI